MIFKIQMKPCTWVSRSGEKGQCHHESQWYYYDGHIIANCTFRFTIRCGLCYRYSMSGIKGRWTDTSTFDICVGHNVQWLWLYVAVRGFSAWWCSWSHMPVNRMNIFNSHATTVDSGTRHENEFLKSEMDFILFQWYSVSQPWFNGQNWKMSYLLISDINFPVQCCL